MSLTLNGEIIPDEGYVLASDIGEDSGGLLCNTDRSDCCRGIDGAAQGHWYFPDPPGGQVLIRGTRETGDFFYRDRGARIVRLNRQGTGTPPERGRFRCEVPNADGAYVDLYINIGECCDDCKLNYREFFLCNFTVDMMVSITPSGDNTAGESYSLECTVTVTGSTDQPTITWLMGPMDNMITSGVMTAGSMSTLTFNPLAASHAGTYTCRATLGSMEVYTLFEIIVRGTYQ